MALVKHFTDEYDSTEYNIFFNMIKKEAEYALGWAYIVTKNSLPYEPRPLFCFFYHLCTE